MEARVAFALAAAAGAAYSFIEPYRYRLRERSVTLAGGAVKASILHLSDLHLNARDRRLIDFLRKLPDRLDEVPELVVATGDLIEDNSGIEPLVDIFSGLEARWGKFYVLGSHDYYQTRFQSYLKYFSTRGRPPRSPRADTKALEEGLRSKGWAGVVNSASVIDSAAGKVRVAGVDDPFLDRHSTGHIRRARGEILAVGLVHAPDVVSEWLLRGFDIVLAGHTHAGQVRIPVVGAVVTNSSLPAALAGGLHRIGSGWLHVSPGLGSGKFAPIRFNCPPEVTLLRLTPRSRSFGST